MEKDCENGSGSFVLKLADVKLCSKVVYVLRKVK